MGEALLRVLATGDPMVVSVVMAARISGLSLTGVLSLCAPTTLIASMAAGLKGSFQVSRAKPWVHRAFIKGAVDGPEWGTYHQTTCFTDLLHLTKS